MADLRKVIEPGTVTILQDKQLQVREDTVVYEDLRELSRTYHRYVLEPGDGVDGKPLLVQQLAGLLWTPEIIARWDEVRRQRRESGLPPVALPSPQP